MPAARLLALAGAVLVSAPAAQAARPVKLAQNAEVAGLTGAGRNVVALLDRGPSDGPFTLVRSGGKNRKRIGKAGPAGAEFPMLAADPRGRVVAGWSRAISGGAQLTAQRVPKGRAFDVTSATGPGRAAVTPGGALVVAHPDQAGDIAVTTVPGVTREPRGDDAYGGTRRDVLTSDAPQRRHFAVALALREDGPLVLDLVQRRRRSALQVVGTGAPRGALLRLRRLDQIEGAIAASEKLVAVAFVRGGRPVLATAKPGRRWRLRTLPGRDVSGAPAVALSGRKVVVAWSQPARGRARDVRAAVVGARVKVRRVTRSAADDGPPRLAPAGRSRVLAAWTSTRGAARTALLRRLR